MKKFLLGLFETIMVLVITVLIGIGIINYVEKEGYAVYAIPEGETLFEMAESKIQQEYLYTMTDVKGSIDINGVTYYLVQQDK